MSFFEYPVLTPTFPPRDWDYRHLLHPIALRGVWVCDLKSSDLLRKCITSRTQRCLFIIGCPVTVMVSKVQGSLGEDIVR